MSPFMLLFPLSASMESSINMLSKNIYFYTNIMNIYHAEEDLKTYPRNLMCILKSRLIPFDLFNGEILLILGKIHRCHHYCLISKC